MRIDEPRILDGADITLPQLGGTAESLRRDRYTGLPTGPAALDLLAGQMHRCELTFHYATLLAVDPGFAFSALDELPARRLTQNVKERLRGYDLLCSRGPRRLLILLPETRADTAQLIAERLQDWLDTVSVAHGSCVPARIGLAQMRDGEAPEALVSAAEAALRRISPQDELRVAVAER